MSTNGTAQLTFAQRIDKLNMARAYTRDFGLQIRRIGQMGDKEALLYEIAYRAWWEQPNNIKLQLELIHVWEQFVIRDLDVLERAILQNRFGYKVPT